MAESPSIVWFRNDLRVTDQPALVAACEKKAPILCVYIFEPKEHGLWQLGEGSRFWLYNSLKSLSDEIKKLGGHLIIREGDAASILMDMVQKTHAQDVFWNHLYEPALIKRDAKIRSLLEDSGVQIHSFHGNLLFDPKRVLALHGKPYRQFMPFKNCVLKNLKKEAPLAVPKIKFYAGKMESLPLTKTSLYPPSKWSREWEKYWKVGTKEAHHKLKGFVQSKMSSYEKRRDFPFVRGTSFLSPHLHFGEISPREIWFASKGSKAFQNELLWREFAHHMLLAFPHTPIESLKEEFKKFPWKKDHKLLKSWQEGMTGYPYIDAGMRQLLHTGWMHNRVRMAVASFLVKDLMLPWQEGAKWFWEMLVDADLANNTLNWQWSAGCGSDSAPFFRVFNPIEQGKKFDPQGKYVKEFVPELKDLPAEYLHAPWTAPKEVLKKAHVQLGKNYPYPICNHEEARKSALKAFQHLVKTSAA